MMKIIEILSKGVMVLALIAISFCGCVSKSRAEKKAQEAFMLGQQTALRQIQNAPKVITVQGDVQNNIIPWTNDMTLAKAILAAKWRGLREPKFVTIIRGEESYKIKMSDFIAAGEDLPLEAGDVIILER
jgi:protein involved in polysaccharide export with SLBB domain